MYNRDEQYIGVLGIREECATWNWTKFDRRKHAAAAPGAIGRRGSIRIRYHTDPGGAVADVFAFKEGTLYPVLHKLEAEGCIRAYEKVVDGRRRRYYSITRKGKEQLARERTQWETFSPP